MIKNKPNISINGYGRIGRILHRVLLNRKSANVVSISSRGSAESHAHLLKYDSIYGRLGKEVTAGTDYIQVNGHNKVKVHRDKLPGEVDYSAENIDIVVECTGKFRDRESCEKQLEAGAKKVIISAPGKNEDISLVLGVNNDIYESNKHHIISNASCTTNCLAPLIKVLDENLNIESAHITSIHALTKSQNILDGSHSTDMRRARTAGESFIPTSTGASRAIENIFPALEGKLSALCIRVPFSTVSLVDLTCMVGNKTTTEKINSLFKNASEGELNGILGISMEPLVSIDYKGEKKSCVIDGLTTNVVDEKHIKVLAWYDNEWGYVERLVDLVELVAQPL